MEEDCTETSCYEKNGTQLMETSSSETKSSEVFIETSGSETNGSEVLNATSSSESNSSEVIIKTSSSDVAIQTSGSETNASEVIIETLGSETNVSEVINETSSSEVAIQTSSSESNGSEVIIETSSSEVPIQTSSSETNGSEVIMETSSSETNGSEVIIKSSSSETNGFEVLIETSSSETNGSDVLIETSGSKAYSTEVFFETNSETNDFSKKQQGCNSSKSLEVEKGEVTCETKTVTENSDDNEAVTMEANSDENGRVECSVAEVTAELHQNQKGEVGNVMQVSEVNLMISSEETQEKVEIFNENVTIEIIENISGAPVEEIENEEGMNVQGSFEINQTTEESVESSNLKLEETSASWSHGIQNGGKEVHFEKEEMSVKETSLDQSNNISQYFSAEESFTETDTEWQFSKEISSDTETTTSITNVGCVPDHTTDSVGYVPDNTTGTDSAGVVVTPDLIKACNDASPDSSQQVRE